jgi:hypothetical protein
MPYEIHAYCTSETAPTIREFLEGLRYYEDGSPRMQADAPGESAKALDSSKWREFELVYGSDKQSLLLGCYRNTGAPVTVRADRTGPTRNRVEVQGLAGQATGL